MTGLATYIDQMMSLFPDRQYNRSKLRSISDECTNYTGTHNYLFDKRFHKHYELYLDLLQSDGMTREQLHSWSRLLRNLADNDPPEKIITTFNSLITPNATSKICADIFICMINDGIHGFPIQVETFSDIIKLFIAYKIIADVDTFIDEGLLNSVYGFSVVASNKLYIMLRGYEKVDVMVSGLYCVLNGQGELR
jgi:hypothetical protein